MPFISNRPPPSTTTTAESISALPQTAKPNSQDHKIERDLKKANVLPLDNPNRDRSKFELILRAQEKKGKSQVAAVSLAAIKTAIPIPVARFFMGRSVDKQRKAEIRERMQSEQTVDHASGPQVATRPPRDLYDTSDEGLDLAMTQENKRAALQRTDKDDKCATKSGPPLASDAQAAIETGALGR